MDKITDAKSTLRRDMKALRASISLYEKNLLDIKMQEKLFDSSLYKQADTLLTFISIGSEPDTLKIIKRAVQDGKTVAVPKCLPKKQMAFYIIKDISDCEEGAYGIFEPKSFCTEADYKSGNIICLVPGLAFDRKFARIGYGGGYYDRFLAVHSNIFAIGYCPERCVIEKVPTEDTDIRLGGLITEKTVEVLYGK